MRKYYHLLSALFVSIGVSISIPSQAHSYPLQNAGQNIRKNINFKKLQNSGR